MNAEILMFLGGATAFLLTLYWVRVRELRERYPIGWVAVGSSLLVCGCMPGVVILLAKQMHLAYPTLVLFISLGAIYLYSFCVSVALSVLHRRNVSLTQRTAIMEYELKELRNQVRDLAALHGSAPDQQEPRDTVRVIPMSGFTSKRKSA